MDLFDRLHLKVPHFDADYCPATERVRRANGRPHTGKRVNQVLREIDQWRRQRLSELGLVGKQLDDGINYCHRGYTVEAAAKLVLAGGLRPGMFQTGAA